ncbi:MAG TPA: D-2-hydroxyacid dehydrogenase [Spirochaetia bacterium]|nr:D-2-hydroxyacid dehydrogenase [Spirochaetia bacterium]
MARRDPLIFISEELTAEQHAAIAGIAPGARLVESSELASDPALVERIDICYSSLPPALWEKARNLSWVQLKWAGVETTLGLPQVMAHSAAITNVHIHGNAVCEHLWGMVLMLTRNLKGAVTAQAEQRWDESLRNGLATIAGRTLCIVGFGAIGASCATVGKALGMRVVGIRRHPAASASADLVVGPEKRLEVFAESRIIMVMLPDTEDTRAFIGREELAVMNGVFLLNAGRGRSIDTPALVDALHAGRVRGAGLDVTDPEPLPQGHPLWAMPNVIITPHYAGDHPGYDKEAFSFFLDNLGRWVRGEPLRNIVDRRSGY